MKTPLLAVLLLTAFAARAQEPVELSVLSFNIWYGGDQVSFDKVIEAIRAADADIVGLQEPDGRTLELAARAGYPYADPRRHILSRFPLFDSGTGEPASTEAPPYSIAGTDPDAVHAWALVGPGRVVALANTHLTSDPYGPELLRDGATVADVLQNEQDTRMAEAQALIDALAPLAQAGIPVILTGDFNSPSWRDWQAAPDPVDWPVSRAIEEAGFTDSFRAAHPDAAATPGQTWTPGRPWPHLPEGETHDRIDFIWTANASALSSTLVGEPGGSDVSVAVAPWPSDHRAVLTSLRLTPAEAPALIAVEPRPVREGDSFVIRASSPGGAPYSIAVVAAGADAAEGAITGIAEVDPADRPTIRLSTLGLPPAAYDAVLLGPEGGELARTRFHVIPADGRATIALAQEKVVPGGDIALSFSGAPGFRLDWVGVYRKGDPSVYGYLGFAYTGGRIAGDLVFPAAELYEDLTPGEYELRLMFDDHYRILAVAPFTVTAN